MPLDIYNQGASLIVGAPLRGVNQSSVTVPAGAQSLLLASAPLVVNLNRGDGLLIEYCTVALQPGLGATGLGVLSAGGFVVAATGAQRFPFAQSISTGLNIPQSTGGSLVIEFASALSPILAEDLAILIPNPYPIQVIAIEADIGIVSVAALDQDVFGTLRYRVRIVSGTTEG